MLKKLTHLLLITLLCVVFLIPINEIYARRPKRIKIISPSAVQQITPSPTRTPKPTKTPIPTPTVRPTRSPTPAKTSIPISNTDTKQGFIMRKINEYRRSQNLSEVKTDSYSCSFARVRAEEISKSFNHNGFRSRVDSKTLPYPAYKSVTENIAMTSDYTQVVEMWVNSPGHAENMRKDTPFVCVESYGNYYAYEGWKP